VEVTHTVAADVVKGEKARKRFTSVCGAAPRTVGATTNEHNKHDVLA